MGTSGESRYHQLDLYQPGDFVRRLGEEMQPHFEAARLVLKSYLLNHSRDFARTLPHRIYNEQVAVEFCATDLLEMGKQLDFEVDMYVFVARQLEDEAKHFMMLSKVYERATSERVRIADLRPTNSQAALFSGVLDPGQRLKRAVIRFANEGTALFNAKATSEMVGGEVGEAYRVIARDEYFHNKLGQLALERYSSSAEMRDEIRKLIALQRRRSINMWFELYGYSKEADELWRSSYGDPSPR